MIKMFYLTHKWDPNRYYHPSQSEPGSNDNKGVLHIPESFKTGASLLNGLVLYPGHSLQEDLLFCRDVVDIFYSLRQLGWIITVYTQVMKDFV